jgi:hypothetical protein
MSPRFRPAPGSLRLALALVLCAGLLSACYRFTGGGLPNHVRTVAVLPFDNETVQPLLETDIQRELQTSLPRNLGVRLAEQALADAVVRGRVTGYEEIAASVRPTGMGLPGANQVPVIQRQIRILYDAEIYDLREDRPIWRTQGNSVIGTFQPESETPDAGRARAIRELVTRMVEGAQSQW